MLSTKVNDAHVQLLSSTDLSRGSTSSRCPFTKTLNWINNFVAMPHKDVGRQGPVCPFMPRALKSDSIFFHTVHTDNLSLSKLDIIIQGFAKTFHTIKPDKGKARLNKAIVLLFPDVTPETAKEVIENTQRRLKRFFVARGLMLGEFHQNHQGKGLRNDKFHPLQSPVPLLVIRHMIPSDLPFLIRKSDALRDRVHFLLCYLKAFAWTLPSEKRTELMSATKEIFTDFTDKPVSWLPPMVQNY